MRLPLCLKEQRRRLDVASAAHAANHVPVPNLNDAGVIVGQTTGMKAWFYADGKRHPLGTLVPRVHYEVFPRVRP